MAEDKTMIPDIKDSTKEERESYIKDKTREERIRIVNKSLEVCGQECQFCNGCDNIGGGRTETFYQPYIDGERELREINAEYIAGRVKG